MSITLQQLQDSHRTKATEANHNIDPELLEGWIDSQGVQAVLSQIQEICYGKAQHLQENWQDEKSAKVWERMGKAIDKAWTKAGDLGL